MLSRNNSSTDGSKMPKDWLDNLSDFLNENYRDSLIAKNLVFKTFGEIHNNEICLGISLLNPNHEKSIPTTLILSSDIAKGPNSENNINKMIDFSGLIFDNYFLNNDTIEYQPNWTSEQFKNLTIFYKITRENIDLTIEANKMLNGS